MSRGRTTILGRALDAIRGPHSERGDAALVLDLCSVAGFSILALAVAASLASPDPMRIALGLLLLPLGIAFSDFVTGLVHWFADTFFDEDTPVLGPALIYAFRDHHVDPRGMERRGFFEVSGNNALACCLPLAALLAWGEPLGAMGFALQVFVFWSALAMFATNQFHKWAHSRRVPPGVRWLQQKGWLLSAKAHAVHHAPDHSRAYCVTVGWLNPWLDRVHFFARLEAGVRRLQNLREGA